MPTLHIHHLRRRTQAHHTHTSPRVPPVIPATAAAAGAQTCLCIPCTALPNCCTAALLLLLLQGFADTLTRLALPPAPHHLPRGFPDN
jgi:hypothetical protein